MYELTPWNDPNKSEKDFFPMIWFLEQVPYNKSTRQERDKDTALITSMVSDTKNLLWMREVSFFEKIATFGSTSILILEYILLEVQNELSSFLT